MSNLTLQSTISFCGTQEFVEIRKKQREAQEKMDEKEEEMLERWNKEKEQGKVNGDDVEELLHCE
jgi:hypothetical protein